MNELDEILDYARQRGDEGDLPEMARVLEERMENFPEEPAVLCWLGIARREMGDEGAAYALFKEAVAMNPDDPHILATLGGALAHSDDPDAEPALRMAALSAPDLPFARWMYGAYLSREGMCEEGIKELQIAAGLDDEDPTIPLELGIAYALNDEIPKARLAVARAVELDPQDGWSMVILGLLEAEEGDLEEAAADLATGAEARLEDVQAQVLAALALGAAGWEQRAYEMVERARVRAEGLDHDSLLAVESRIDDGPEAALEYFKTTVAPLALRERLMARP